MDQFLATRIFLRVAEAGSFSAVAREFGVSQPTVSKIIAALERKVGAELMRRTSRSLALTEAGQCFYEGAHRAVSALDEAEQLAKKGTLNATGTLRVTLSAGFGRLHILPLLPEFLAQHQSLAVDILVSDRFLDLIEEGLDLAIRISDLPDSRLVAKKIDASRRGTFASRAYLERHGLPSTPDDLNRHCCIGFLSQGALRPWIFEKAGETVTVSPAGRLRANDAELIREAVLSSMGLASVPAWLFAEELRSGEAVEVLGEWHQGLTPIQAVYPATRILPNKVRVFIDFLAARLSGAQSPSPS